MRIDGDEYKGKADHPRCPATPGLYVFIILQQAFVLLAFVCLFTKTTIDDTAQQRFLHDLNKSRGDVLISQELLPACGSPLSARGGGANFPPTGVSTRRFICNSKPSCGTTEALPDANDNRFAVTGDAPVPQDVRQDLRVLNVAYSLLVSEAREGFSSTLTAQRFNCSCGTTEFISPFAVPELIHSGRVYLSLQLGRSSTKPSSASVALQLATKISTQPGQSIRRALPAAGRLTLSACYEDFEWDETEHNTASGYAQEYEIHYTATETGEVVLPSILSLGTSGGVKVPRSSTRSLGLITRGNEGLITHRMATMTTTMNRTDDDATSLTTYTTKHFGLITQLAAAGFISLSAYAELNGTVNDFYGHEKHALHSNMPLVLRTSRGEHFNDVTGYDDDVTVAALTNVSPQAIPSGSSSFILCGVVPVVNGLSARTPAMNLHPGLPVPAMNLHPDLPVPMTFQHLGYDHNAPSLCVDYFDATLEFSSEGRASDNFTAAPDFVSPSAPAPYNGEIALAPLRGGELYIGMLRSPPSLASSPTISYLRSMGGTVFRAMVLMGGTVLCAIA